MENFFMLGHFYKVHIPKKSAGLKANISFVYHLHFTIHWKFGFDLLKDQYFLILKEYLVLVKILTFLSIIHPVIFFL